MRSRNCLLSDWIIEIKNKSSGIPYMLSKIFAAGLKFKYQIWEGHITYNGSMILGRGTHWNLLTVYKIRSRIYVLQGVYALASSSVFQEQQKGKENTTSGALLTLITKQRKKEIEEMKEELQNILKKKNIWEYFHTILIWRLLRMITQ